MSITPTLKAFWKDQAGGQVVEWPLFASLLALAAIAGWGILDGHVASSFTDIGEAISGTGANVNAP